MKNITITEVRKLKVADLRTLATEMGIPTQTEYSTQEDGVDVTEMVNKKKSHLLDDVIAKLRETSVEKEFVPTKEQTAIIEDTSLSKSAKMRALYDCGVKIADIARAIGAHYSFVHSTITTYKLRMKVRAADEVTPVDNDAVAEAVKAASPKKKTTRKSASSKKKMTAK